MNIAPIEELVAPVQWLLRDASCGIGLGLYTGKCFQWEAGGAASDLGLHLRESMANVKHGPTNPSGESPDKWSMTQSHRWWTELLKSSFVPNVLLQISDGALGRCSTAWPY